MVDLVEAVDKTALTVLVLLIKVSQAHRVPVVITAVVVVLLLLVR
jgi:hypothetical protein